VLELTLLNCGTGVCLSMCATRRVPVARGTSRDDPRRRPGLVTYICQVTNICPLHGAVVAVMRRGREGGLFTIEIAGEEMRPETQTREVYLYITKGGRFIYNRDCWRGNETRNSNQGGLFIYNQRREVYLQSRLLERK